MQINDTKEQSGSNTEGGTKFEEPLNGNGFEVAAGNGFEVAADNKLIQNDTEEQNGSKTEGGRKFEEPLNGNGVSAKGDDEDSSSSASSKKVNVPVPPKGCSFSQFVRWIGEETKGMDLAAHMAFLRSIPANPNCKSKAVPEDKEWRRIDTPYSTSFYPPPNQVPSEFSYHFDVVMARKPGQPYSDIIADKKTRYTIGIGENK